MNIITSEKYKSLNASLGEIIDELANMDKAYKELMPKLALVDKLDMKVTGLEKMAYSLDAYSKRLGE